MSVDNAPCALTSSLAPAVVAPIVTLPFKRVVPFTSKRNPASVYVPPFWIKTLPVLNTLSLSTLLVLKLINPFCLFKKNTSKPFASKPIWNPVVEEFPVFVLLSEIYDSAGLKTLSWYCGAFVPSPNLLLVLFQNKPLSPVWLFVPFQKTTWPFAPVPVTGFVSVFCFVANPSTTAWVVGYFVLSGLVKLVALFATFSGV
jgi:hypothetical protein